MKSDSGSAPAVERPTPLKLREDDILILRAPSRDFGRQALVDQARLLHEETGHFVIVLQPGYDLESIGRWELEQLLRRMDES